MKKIMFNDKYGLTRAVLEGRKTQTRRIAYNGEVPNLIKGYGYEGHVCGSAAIFLQRMGEGTWLQDRT